MYSVALNKLREYFRVLAELRGKVLNVSSDDCTGRVRNLDEFILDSVLSGVMFDSFSWHGFKHCEKKS